MPKTPEDQPLAADDILRLKDEMLTAFAALPAEHQATISLVLIQTVMRGDWGAWLVDALALSHSTLPRLGYTIRRDALDQTNLSAEEIAQLSDDDLANIARIVNDHLTNDVFWNEVNFIAEQVLNTKHTAERPENA